MKNYHFEEGKLTQNLLLFQRVQDRFKIDSLITALLKFLNFNEAVLCDPLQSTSNMFTKVHAARATRLFLHSINHFSTAPFHVFQIMFY